MQGLTPFPQRALACPDKFRGTLTAAAAAAAIAAGLRDAGLREVVELPLADGGEGTLDVLLAALGGERRTAVVSGPAEAPVIAAWGLLQDGTAVVEMAQASGLALTRGANDPVSATTRGTGELVLAAAEAGATEVVLGVGGSATVDGGLGALEAVGWRLPVPVVVACDVDTPFVAAARLYGPQKGANPAQVRELTGRLERLAERLRERTGVDVSALPGAGAAGGLAGGLAAIGATLRPGFAVVAEAVRLRDRLETAELVVTGEGRLDATSLAGKVVGEVLAAAAGRGRGVVAGEIDAAARALLPHGVQAISLVELAGSPGRARAGAASLVRRAAAAIGAASGAETA